MPVKWLVPSCFVTCVYYVMSPVLGLLANLLAAQQAHAKAHAQPRPTTLIGPRIIGPRVLSVNLQIGRHDDRHSGGGGGGRSSAGGTPEDDAVAPRKRQVRALLCAYMQCTCHTRERMHTCIHAWGVHVRTCHAHTDEGASSIRYVHSSSWVRTGRPDLCTHAIHMPYI